MGADCILATTSLCCYCFRVETPSHVFYEAKVDIDKAQGYLRQHSVPKGVASTPRRPYWSRDVPVSPLSPQG